MQLYYDTHHIFFYLLTFLLPTSLFLASEPPIEPSPGVDDYYQYDNAYYPMLNPTIIIYGDKNNEAIKSAIANSTYLLKENQKIVICSYLKPKITRPSLAERKILSDRKKYSILLIFNLIMLHNNRHKSYLMSVDADKKSLKNGRTVGVIKIPKEALFGKHYIDYFTTLLAPDVMSNIKNDEILAKQYSLSGKSESEKEKAANLYLETMIDQFRQEYLYWDRVEDILHSQTLTTNNIIILDMLKTTPKGVKKVKITIQLEETSKKTIQLFYKLENGQHIIQVKGFKNSYNKANRETIFETIQKKLKDYDFDSATNIERYERLFHPQKNNFAKNKAESSKSKKDDKQPKKINSGNEDQITTPYKNLEAPPSFSDDEEEGEKEEEERLFEESLLTEDDEGHQNNNTQSLALLAAGSFLLAGFTTRMTTKLATKKETMTTKQA